MCRLFWPLLKAAQGSITTLAVGLLARRVRTFRLVLSVNAAMGNFSKALSQLGKRDGVNVNVIHPGATETERFYQLLEQRSKASGKSVDQLKQEATAKDGLRRLGKRLGWALAPHHHGRFADARRVSAGFRHCQEQIQPM
jgi:3-oxoacyl-[acyl-carrier protein] reductase